MEKRLLILSFHKMLHAIQQEKIKIADNPADRKIDGQETFGELDQAIFYPACDKKHAISGTNNRSTTQDKYCLAAIVGRAIIKADKEGRAKWRQTANQRSITELSNLLCANSLGPDQGYPLLADPGASYIELADEEFKKKVIEFVEQSGQSDDAPIDARPKRLPLTIII